MPYVMIRAKSRRHRWAPPKLAVKTPRRTPMRPFRTILALAVLALLALGTETASAQKFAWAVQGAKTQIPSTGAPDLLKVNYFSNANTAGAPDGTVQITNPGSPTGNLCAQIYVSDPYQELSECCACLVTP